MDSHNSDSFMSSITVEKGTFILGGIIIGALLPFLFGHFGYILLFCLILFFMVRYTMIKKHRDFLNEFEEMLSNNSDEN